jgi:hypothetical protein
MGSLNLVNDARTYPLRYDERIGPRAKTRRLKSMRDEYWERTVGGTTRIVYRRFITPNWCRTVSLGRGETDRARAS